MMVSLMNPQPVAITFAPDGLLPYLGIDFFSAGARLSYRSEAVE
jgi:hypothetical protein